MNFRDGLLRLHSSSVPLEDFFTEVCAGLFGYDPELCLRWLEEVGALSEARQARLTGCWERTTTWRRADSSQRASTASRASRRTTPTCPGEVTPDGPPAAFLDSLTACPAWAPGAMDKALG
jgi:hypothetical protein